MPKERNPRMERERKTIAAMIRLYCRGHHPGPERPCAECRELLAYALERLDRCPFQEGKTTCAHCPVHCYKPSMRERVRAVMRYSGPRMLLRHPILALLHLWDGRRKEPVRHR
ncbi:nitrous oxide-stimulated promoter family protein [Deferrisoma palaeochoriense]